MAEDPLSELMRAIAEGFTPVKLGQRLAGSPNKPAGNKAGPPINKRLPRIVPDGKGNLIDLNTNAVVGKAPAQPSASKPSVFEPLSKIPQAFMSGLGESGQQILSDISDVLSGKFVGPLSRISQVAGELPIGKMAKQGSAVAKSIITPKTWHLMEPEAKAMLNNLADKFPDLFKKIMDSPTKLMANVSESMPGLLGSLATNKTAKSFADKLNRPDLLDKPISAYMDVVKSQVKESTVPHEVQHFLNFPKIQATDPADAGTIGMLLSDVLSGKSQGSLQQRMQEFRGTRIPARPPPTPTVWKGASHVSRAVNTAANAPVEGPAAQSLVNAGEGYYKTGEPRSDFLQRAMMDEGLAHLAEQTIKPQGDKTLMDLALKLGVGTGSKYEGPPTPDKLPDDIMSYIQRVLGGQ